MSLNVAFTSEKLSSVHSLLFSYKNTRESLIAVYYMFLNKSVMKTSFHEN